MVVSGVYENFFVGFVVFVFDFLRGSGGGLNFFFWVVVGIGFIVVKLLNVDEIFG